MTFSPWRSSLRTILYACQSSAPSFAKATTFHCQITKMCTVIGTRNEFCGCVVIQEVLQCGLGRDDIPCSHAMFQLLTVYDCVVHLKVSSDTD